jgi:alpha-N-arabinofuranosidase
MKKNKGADKGAVVYLDREFTVGETDPRLFGSFLEHLGRAIYGGIYEPGHPSADAEGFRRDVLDLIAELRVPVIRYPGGNFVSSFKWEDSVGPVSSRPRRLDLAWRACEPNEFGLNEFMRWVKKAGAEPMLAINLGTRGIEDAVNLAEYCNHPRDSYWSDLRRSHGVAEPHNVKLWCLGNEMDGPWQVGQKTPDEYGRLAFETAKALKLFDPKSELVVCGSSGPGMPTFPHWEETVLGHCYEKVDYLSLHQYQQNKAGDLPTYLACSLGMDRFIDSVVATCDFAQAKRRSKKRINLSFDEWNVWFHTLDSDKEQEPWIVGPHLLEDVYTFEDALVVGCLLNSLLRHADRVKIACLAQLVNVIAPIMTENGGRAWKQTIFWPFYYASRYGRGTVLDVRVKTGFYENAEYGEVPWLDSVAVLSPEGTQIALFMVNRSVDTPLPVDCRLAGFEGFRVQEQVELAGQKPETVNTAEKPDAVRPVVKTPGSSASGGGAVRVTLAPMSWNMVVLTR